MIKSRCPACYAETAIKLEDINLQSQHALYAREDTAAQMELTQAAKLSADSYTMHKCINCGLEYANPLVAPNTYWYSLAYKLLSLYPEARWEFDYVITRLNPAAFVGELGCGVGFFLKKCIANNINCQGFDFSKEVIEQCLTENLPVNLLDLSNPNTEQIIGREKFNTMVLFHVLEHLDNPNKVFNLAWKCTTDNSDLWISVPSDRRLTRSFNEKDFMDQPPHHLTRWSENSLKIIGHNSGWNLQELIYEPMTFKNILWSYSTRFFYYKKLLSKIKYANIWAERFFRYSIYPLSMILWLTSKSKITGFSMLARYSKNKNFQYQ
ncbi:hypothetical protein NIES22_06670 [Calothrix brevissima NIES-22]|nr:hypothetical protein NIES22_06670 [Calothrix brevissima NIES-22]